MASQLVSVAGFRRTKSRKLAKPNSYGDNSTHLSVISNTHSKNSYSYRNNVGDDDNGKDRVLVDSSACYRRRKGGGDRKSVMTPPPAWSSWLGNNNNNKHNQGRRHVAISRSFNRFYVRCLMSPAAYILRKVKGFYYNGFCGDHDPLVVTYIKGGGSGGGGGGGPGGGDGILM
ncbi:hypothetical protein BVC80_1833g42 [Macleaya cordata]|uniref:Uncharacterized protein n=1 Tax=Macleaya cordata TaxID=56857 RepID=A0A200R6M6_MACCD|nr:hypothetical protein BVC80_1833g42 [Macleaya cordata]